MSFVRYLVVLAGLTACATAAAQQWRPVPAGARFNISGMALIEQKEDAVSFLIVQDNKRPEEDRAGLLAIRGDEAPEYRSLAWPDGSELPMDLEAVCRIPGTKNEFVAIESRGQAYHLKLQENGSTWTVTLKDTFELPRVTDNPNYEGFAVQQMGDSLLAVWAHRGQDADPALISWSTLKLPGGKLGPVKTEKFTAPWPDRSEVRHASDLKVDTAGVLYITSASDPGNFGPFQSAAWVAGTFHPAGEHFGFRLNDEPVRIQASRYNKAEALELIPGKQGGLVLGSDDETVGGAVWTGW